MPLINSYRLLQYLNILHKVFNFMNLDTAFIHWISFIYADEYDISKKVKDTIRPAAASIDQLSLEIKVLILIYSEANFVYNLISVNFSASDIFKSKLSPSSLHQHCKLCQLNTTEKMCHGDGQYFLKGYVILLHIIYKLSIKAQ